MYWEITAVMNKVWLALRHVRIVKHAGKEKTARLRKCGAVIIVQ